MIRISSPAQRTRRLLNQAAMQRSHRRGELIRVIVDIEPESSVLNSDDAAKQAAEDRHSSELLENG